MSYATPEEMARRQAQESDMRRVAREELESLQAGRQPLATIEPPDPKPMSEKGKQYIIAMTFKSSHDDVPHIVSLGPDGLVRCTCKAMLSIEYRPQGCWAMVEFRDIVGIEQP